jgi:hypothetical protein
MRGRLIQRFVAVFRRLDVVATAAVPAGGFDDEFNSLRPVPDGTQAGSSTRVEHDEERVPCQLDPTDWGSALLSRGGLEDSLDLQLTLHMPDLDRLGLLDANNKPVFAAGDRIDSIETRTGLIQAKFDNPPGLFVTKVELRGWGLAAFGTPKVNLVVLTVAPQRVGS